MIGYPPLGYVVKDRKLIINEGDGDQPQPVAGRSG
jgi:hypothetical protein